ncbi:hypothetical protein FACUT_6508 [Fusarium acutatum]|uniref:Uncharacterized protein n=1 Tax=Fusarium acutatum TaxID=78861 RepID=A0A8H4JSR7_9HYPO|nr:hypothetical protein FACUT_6508 [Fusarium acutatum]
MEDARTTNTEPKLRRPSSTMPVQQHVLNWLYSVLTSEYHDVNRAYNDVAQALDRFPSLSPRTDVHTFSNGANALLLHLSGTLPVNFRGTTYRFPISIWVPHAYPREPPMIYVVPTETMMIRPGQHIDPQGLVYHPYLVGWAEFWDKSNLRDFLNILTDIFAKEPPVVARQPQARPPPAQANPTPPPVPPLPPGMGSTSRPATQDPHPSEQPRPPPPPPKGPQTTSPAQTQSQNGPPLPPIPGRSPAQSNRMSRYESAPPLPPQVGSPIAQDPRLPRPQEQYATRHMPPAGPLMAAQPGYMNDTQSFTPPSQQQWQMPPQHQQYQQPPQPPAWTAQAAPPPQSPAKPPPPPDLLDEPLELSLPNTTVAAPPIPPNPEKDALLRQLAQTLYSIRMRSRQQNDSSMAGLQAQRTAMLSAIPAFQAEGGQLTQLSNVLTSNSNILHDALHKADAVIEGSKSHPVPDVDELLVAPTVVANQLYTLVAEERAIGDAIFMLGRAVERGRITPAVFAKTTRTLAREWYLKKALVRKIGQGMGLAS